MPRRPRKKGYGTATPSLGWKKLEDWCEAGNTISELARKTGVAQPSAYSWRWLDKAPSDEYLDAICELTRASRADWLVAIPRPRDRRKARKDAAA